MRYAMAIDTKKCVGCADCVVACQTEKIRIYNKLYLLGEIIAKYNDLWLENYVKRNNIVKYRRLGLAAK